MTCRHEHSAIICSNLSKACEKQHRSEEAELLRTLAAYFWKTSEPTIEQASFADMSARIQEDLNSLYPSLSEKAENRADRGVQRALVWGRKVTAIQKSLLARFEKQKEQLIKDESLYVCEACGFISIGSKPPERCPVCKAPASRFTAIS